MSFFKVQFTACAVLALLSPAAYADLTAEDVWSDWKSYLGGMGYRISGNERRSSDDLIVNNVKMTTNLGEDVGTASATIERLVFAENGDGSVNIVFPNAMKMETTLTDSDGQTFSSEIDYAHTGLDINVSGTPEALKYIYSGQTITVKSSSFATGDTGDLGVEAAFEVNMNGLSGSIDMEIGDLRNFDQIMKVTNVTYDVDVTVPDDDGSVTLNGKLDNMNFDGTGTIPLTVIDGSDANAMLSAGFSLDGNIDFGANTADLQMAAPDGTNSANVTSQSGTYAIKMGPDGLTYDTSSIGLSVEARTSLFPLPVFFNIAKAGSKLTMPLQKSDESQDFAFGFTLADFTMSDALWGLFDPSAQLPRDPATLIVDLAGKGRLLFDFLAPEAAEAALDPGFNPGEVETLDVNKLQLTLAGAELTGKGAMTFDNSIPSIGMPKPVGAVDFKLVGGNGLLDKLVSVGLLPEEQAMGARMMMGLLATPGTGPDTLNSKIEFNEQGHVIANGQRIQ